jgi:predicted transcriptional regulator
MPLEANHQIRKRILKLLLDRGGSISKEEWRHIEAGSIELDRHLAELIVQGCIRHDQEARIYSLTDTGRNELAHLRDSGDSPGS